VDVSNEKDVQIGWQMSSLWRTRAPRGKLIFRQKKPTFISNILEINFFFREKQEQEKRPFVKFMRSYWDKAWPY
jgi:hypothetical protein